MEGNGIPANKQVFYFMGVEQAQEVSEVSR
jgi:hypothetical protein